MLGLLTAGASLAGEQSWAQELWRAGLGALLHAESSWTRDQTCVPSLAGGFSTTGPPGKPLVILSKEKLSILLLLYNLFVYGLRESPALQVDSLH